MDDEELLREIFEIFDKDGSGEICVQEFGNVLRAMHFNPTESEVQKLIKDYDKDGSGKMDFDELKAWFKESRKKLPNDTQQELERAFKIFDKNNDGFINLKEIRQLMETMGETVTDEDVREMLESCDLDRDERISITEFASFLNKPMPKSKR